MIHQALSSLPPLLIRRLWQPLNNIPPPPNAHHRHSRNLPQPPLQARIIRRHDVNPRSHDPAHDAIVRIRPLVPTPDPLEPRIPRDLERDAEPRAQLLEFSHDAVGHDGRARRVQRVQQAGERVDAVGYGKVEEVCVD